MSTAKRDLPQTRTNNTIVRIQSQPDQFANLEEPPSALDTSRRQLETAMRKNDELRQLRSLLTKRVSSLEIALAKAHRFAHYDELTGLPNRRLLHDRFSQASALASRHHQLLVMLFFDVNNFKDVNDELGHEAGDKLLQQVATRLSTAIRTSDTACRYGGDEFVVLMTEIVDLRHAVKAVQKMRAKLAPPYVFDGYSIRLTLSNGMAIYPTDAQCFTDLMRLSDRSMFRDKSGGRGQPGGAPKMQDSKTARAKCDLTMTTAKGIYKSAPQKCDGLGGADRTACECTDDAIRATSSPDAAARHDAAWLSAK